MAALIMTDVPLYGSDVCRVAISPGLAIAIVKIAGSPHKMGLGPVFGIGDTCVVGSYNLIYTGEILGITEKNVIVMRHGRKAHLKIAQFVSYNWDYDAKHIAAHNHETSMSI